MALASRPGGLRRVANYQERPALETFLDAANRLSLDEVWRADAPQQAKRHNRETRVFCVGEELPTEANATRTVRWAEKLYEAAAAYIRAEDPALILTRKRMHGSALGTNGGGSSPGPNLAERQASTKLESLKLGHGQAAAYCPAAAHDFWASP